jgi:hypothetical protein
MPTSSKPRFNSWASIASACWLLSVCSGLLLFEIYKATPGSARQAPATYPLQPSQNALRTAGAPTLLLFAHPRCPCTRASLNELAVLLSKVDRPVRAEVLFMLPPGTSDDWTSTSLQQLARQIPGVTVKQDMAGALAKRFGAETSGHVVVYDPRGRLQFSGGITGSRGHEGDNASLDALQGILCGKEPPRSTKVFGCPLASPPKIAIQE